MPKEGPIRVLSIVSGKRLCGVAVWMLDVLRHIDRDRFSVDVLLISRGSVASYEERLHALGIRSIHCPLPMVRLGPLGAPGFALRFGRVLREYGPYDVVHDSVTLGVWGVVAGVSRLMGVPVRILHARSMLDPGLSKGNIKRIVSWPINVRAATHFLSVSSCAAMSIFHPDVIHDSRFALNTGIDLSRFDPDVAVQPVKASLGLASETKVVGHIGRFTEEKRHDLWVQVAHEVAKSREDVAFVLVGDGPLRPQIESAVKQIGLSHRFRFLGQRTDVADLMRGSMDVLLFPSRFEGLPRVIVEAQSAGLPCVVSDAVTPEVDVIPSLIERRSLSDPPEAWAETVINALDRGAPLPQPEAFALVAASPYNVVNSIGALERIYATAREPGGPRAQPAQEGR